MAKKLIKSGVLVTAAAAAVLLAGYAAVAGIGSGDGGDVPGLAEAGENKFIIRAHNGRIALFSDSFASAPAVETDIDISLLRAYDRELLENGIEVDTYEDVLRLLEDLGP